MIGRVMQCHHRSRAWAGRFRAHPFGVQVATIAGCLKAEAKTRSSIAFAASQAAALLYSAVAMATDPPESTKSVKMKVMWTSPGTKIPPQGKAALPHAWADQAADRGRCSSSTC